MPKNLSVKKSKKPTRKSSKTSSYISNPFKLAFKGMSNWLEYNQTLSIFVIAVGFGAVIFNVFGPTDSRTMLAVPSNARGGALLLSIFTIFFLIIFSVVLSTIYTGMLAFIGLQTNKKKTVTFSDALKVAIENFWKILIAQFLITLKVIGGLILLIIPGIRASLRYSIVHFYIIDKGYDPVTAMRKAKELTKDHLIEVFGLYFASGIVPVVNGLLLVGGQTEMYAQLSRLKSSKKAKPKVHWLNYLGPVIIVMLMLLIMMALVLFIIALIQLAKPA